MLSSMSELLVVVGARPNFMKAAPLVEAARAAGLSCTLLHTGQHYDEALSRVFFDELQMARPEVDLGVGSGSHAQQTARIMTAFEPELLRIDPKIVVVVGDVNSTLACALVAAKEHYPVAHVEAGLRSYDDRMPEEVNRRLCDHISDYLFTTSADADDNLIREGIARERISLVGNTMIDTLLRFESAARERRFPERLGLAESGYVAMTIHRPETVDDDDALAEAIDAVVGICAVAPVVFPMHPRTKERLVSTGAHERLRSEPNLVVLPPLGYLDFIGLLSSAAVVLTDSGGVQEETTVLGRPCLTMRDSTERPVTVTAGTNRIVGVDAGRIVAETIATLEAPPTTNGIPDLWDGRAGARIVDVLARALQDRPARTIEA
jgi:UDP-N-acetylglucosamine 2-epimerase (non-hydrolysing)